MPYYQVRFAVRFIPFFVPLLLTLAHSVGHLVRLRDRRYTEIAQSFASGFAIGFIFLVIIPEVILLENQIDAQQTLSRDSFEAMFVTFAGFVLFHVALKYIDQHPELPRGRFLNNEVHLTVIALYNLLVAFSLTQLASENLIEALLYTMLFSFHLTISELAEHGKAGNLANRMKLFILILAVWAGSVLPYLDFMSPQATAILFALAAGGVIYISVREEIPWQDSGRPIFFLIGSVLVSLIAVLLF